MMYKRYELAKDFGSKTIQKVFVKEPSTSDDLQSLKDRIGKSLENAETVCIVLADRINAELINMLLHSNSQTGCRIYVIVSDLSRNDDFSLLKNRCIIREVPNISGNWILCNKEEAFFFDSGLHGYTISHPAAVGKLHDIFVYEFWRNGEKEFISDIQTVSERTFEVAPVLGNDRVILDYITSERNPYHALLEDATEYAVPKRINDFVKSKGKQSRIYLDESACKDARNWMLNASLPRIFLTEFSHVPLCRSIDGKWYILNNANFDLTQGEQGRFFAVQLEEEPQFTNVYRLYDEYSYRDSVGKDIISADGFKPITIIASGTEMKAVSYDYLKFNEVVQMDDDNRETEFNSRKLLTSEKLSASVTFSIEMRVKGRSQNAQDDRIYDDYKKFAAFLRSFVEQLKEDSSRKKDSSDQITEEIKKSEGKIADMKRKLKELAKKRSTLEESLKVDSTSPKDKKSLDKEFKELEREIKNSEREIKKLAEELERLNQRLKDTEAQLTADENLLNSLRPFKNQVLTKKSECETVVEVISQSNQKDKGYPPVPQFDLPQCGTLYKSKSGYEYELASEEKLEEAQDEMRKAGITNVIFVAASETNEP